MQENTNDTCVLVYEDDPEILILCKIILQDQYRVETLVRCEHVLSDIARIQPDLILMDLWIPEIGGEKAIQLIRENPATRYIPVLLFSANSDISEISVNVHADGYIKKPFDIVHFTETIQRTIEHRAK